MSWVQAARVVARKELRESLRDRKTLLMMVVLPLVLYPLLFVGMSWVSLAQQEQLEARQLVVGFSGGEVPSALREVIIEGENTLVQPVATPEEALATRQAHAVIRLPEDVRERIAAGEQVEATVYFDGSDEASREAEERVVLAMKRWADDILGQRLKARSLTRDYVEPARIESRNVAPPARQGGWLLGQILPMMVSILMIGGAFYPSIDLTAGEKERGTLQTLLTAPIEPIAIVVGKFGAVVGLTLLTGLVNLASVALLGLLMPLPESVAEEVAFHVGPTQLALLLACMVLMGAMFGAFMMAVAVTARSFKDAQNYLTPVYLICIFPLMLSGLPGVVLDPVYMAVPLVNLALAMKQLLLGDVVMDQLFIVFVSSGLWTAMGLALAARMFSMESVLLGTGGVEALFHRRTGADQRPPVPSVGEAVTLLGVVLTLSFYGSMILGADASVGVLIHTAMWGFLLTPCVLLVAALRLSPQETFVLRRPPAVGLFTAFLLGSGLWYGVSRVMETALEDRWLPMPGPEMQGFSESLEAMAQTPGGAAVLFAGVALAPAICEEALFRGVLLQSLLRQMAPKTAVVISAVVFGLFHMNIYQLPTAILLGIFLGCLVIRFGSIWPAVLLHLLHNGLVLTSELYVPKEVLHHPAAWALCLFPLAGIGLLWRSGTQPNRGP